MEVWLENLTAATETETETSEEDTADNQGGSLPENTDEPDSTVETMSMNKSVIQTASLTPAALLADNTPVATMANTPAAQNDEEYNVVFITENDPEFLEYIELSSPYIKSDGGNVITSLIKNYEIISSDSIKKFDVSSELLRVIGDPNYDKNTKTYIFLIFRETTIYANTAVSLQLKAELDDMENNRPYISFISNLSEYNSDGFLSKLTSETDNKGVFINTKDLASDKTVAVKDAVINYLGIAEAQTQLIIASTGLTALPIDFRDEKIRDYYQEYKSGNGYYLIDTDDDGLENYKEIAFDSKLIKVMPDITLPTFGDCYDILEATGRYMGIKEGFDRFLVSKPYDQIRAVRILPINSDPIKKDGDYDGISDLKEFNLYNGDIRLSLSSTQIVDYSQTMYESNKEKFSYEQSFKLNFSWFFDDIKNNGEIEYNNELSLASIIFAGLAYHTYDESDYIADHSKEYYYAMDGIQVYGKMILPEVMKEFGLNNVKTVNLRKCHDSNWRLYSDNDLVQYDIGVRDISEYKPEGYTGSRNKLVSIFVRGTHGTEEWLSNFDIGNTDDWTGTDDWTTKANHKGFDVAATRAIKEIKQYFKENSINKYSSVIWLTGHSRGAAVSGIIAANLIDEGYTVYGYNFATPNQVEYNGYQDSNYNNDKHPNSYEGIFNIVNQEDLVPCLPMTLWGFRKYGNVKEYTLSKDNQTRWKEKGIDRIYQTSIAISPQTLANRFSDISETRNGCYIYDEDKNKQINLQNSRSLRTLLTEVPELQQYIPELNNGTSIDEIKYIYQEPILFMQILAGVASQDSRFNKGDFMIGSYSAEKYNIKAFDFGLFAIFSGFMNPHYVDAYILVTES
jgi:hypothetical protein